MTLGSGYDSPAPDRNNGNVMSPTISGTGIPTFSQTYTYDKLNRIESVNESSPGNSWNRTYEYDPKGPPPLAPKLH